MTTQYIELGRGLQPWPTNRTPRVNHDRSRSAPIIITDEMADEGRPESPDSGNEPWYEQLQTLEVHDVKMPKRKPKPVSYKKSHYDEGYYTGAVKSTDWARKQREIPKPAPGRACTVNAWELKGIVKENNQFRERNKDLRVDNMHLNEEVQERDGQIVQLRTRLSNMNETFKTACRDLKALLAAVKEVDDKDQEKKSPDEKFFWYFRKLWKCLSNYIKMGEEEERTKNENTMLKSELNKVKKDKGFVEGERDKWQEKFKGLEEKHDQLRRKYETLTQELKDVRDTKNSLKDENFENLSLLKSARVENGEIREENQSLRKEVRDLRDMTGDMRLRIGDLEDQLKRAPKGEIVDELHTYHKKCTRYEAEIKGLKNSIASLLQQIEGTKEQVKRLEGIRKNLDDQVEERENEIKGLRKEIQKRDAKIKELEDSVAASDRGIKHFKNEVTTAQAEHHALKESWKISDEKIQRLESRIKQELTTISERDAQIKKLKKDIKQMSSHILTLEEEKLELEQSMTTFKTKMAKKTVVKVV